MAMYGMKDERGSISDVLIADTIDNARYKAVKYLKKTSKHSIRIYVIGRRESDYAGDVVNLIEGFVWRTNTRGLPSTYTINPKNGKIGKRWVRFDYDGFLIRGY